MTKISVLAFLDIIQERMVVEVLPLDEELGMSRFRAFFNHCECKKDENAQLLKHEFGVGDSIDNAVSNYLDEVRGKLLIFNAYCEGRKEIMCPKNIYWDAST